MDFERKSTYIVDMLEDAFFLGRRKGEIDRLFDCHQVYMIKLYIKEQWVGYNRVVAFFFYMCG